MRMFCLAVLLSLFGAVGILALENREDIAFRFFGQGLSGPHAMLIGIVFLLGMVSGWFAIGFVRRVARESL